MVLICTNGQPNTYNLHLQKGDSHAPVITSLHKSHPRIFNSDSNVFNLPSVREMPKYTSTNKQFLGALLYGFFRYYNEYFDFASDCGSIRCGQRLYIGDCFRYNP